MPIELKLEQPAGKIKMIGGNISIPESEIAETSFFVEIDKKYLFTTNIPIKIGVYSNNKLIEEVNTNFLGPQRRKKIN